MHIKFLWKIPLEKIRLEKREGSRRLTSIWILGCEDGDGGGCVIWRELVLTVLNFQILLPQC